MKDIVQKKLIMMDVLHIVLWIVPLIKLSVQGQSTKMAVKVKALA